MPLLHYRIDYSAVPISERYKVFKMLENTMYAPKDKIGEFVSEAFLPSSVDPNLLDFPDGCKIEQIP